MQKRLWALCTILVLAVLSVPFLQPVQAQTSAPCTRTVAISVIAGASQTLAAAFGSDVVYLCGFTISADTLATTAVFASGSTNLTGVMRLCDECNISSGNFNSVLLETPGGGALTITTVTGAVTGLARIGQH